MFAVAARSVGRLLTATTLVAGCSAPPQDQQAAQASQLSLGWGPCSSAEAPGVECATFSVPYDYSRPDGEMFTIPVARIPSKASKPQLLMMNPGGPGISGVDDLRSGREYYEKFTDVYTVVSFDPRGMGGSKPVVSCIDDQQKAAIFNQPSVPRSGADDQRRQELASGIGAACERQFGSALSHLD